MITSSFILLFISDFIADYFCAAKIYFPNFKSYLSSNGIDFAYRSFGKSSCLIRCCLDCFPPNERLFTSVTPFTLGNLSGYALLTPASPLLKASGLSSSTVGN